MGAFKDFWLGTPQPVVETRETPDLTDVLPPAWNAISYSSDKDMLRISSVYRSVALLGNLVSQLDIETVQDTRVVESPPIIRKPDLNQPRKFFIQQTVTDMALHGECFWLVHYNGNNAAQHIEILDPTQVSVGKQNGRIEYLTNGKKYFADRVKHLKLTRLSGELHGKGPIQLARADIELALLLETYASVQFDARAIPRGKLTTKETLNPDDLSVVTDSVRKFIQDNGGILALTGGFDYQQIVGDPTKNQFIAVQKMVDLKIARSFGIPPELLGMSTDGTSMTYSNIQQVGNQMLSTTLNRYLDEIEEQLSELIVVTKKARFKEEDLMRLDIKGKWEVLNIQAQMGYTSGDELRELEGKQPLPKPPAAKPIEKKEDDDSE